MAHSPDAKVSVQTLIRVLTDVKQYLVAYLLWLLSFKLSKKVLWYSDKYPISKSTKNKQLKMWYLLLFLQKKMILREEGRK